ncbi:hypothetical protein LSUB1_G002849 [Lachnellula subtilissima]|uniref:DUF7719 domain-containing protein n=1 Tax=Lachnellula subtilissima TaxID=602034 RepID=A0A8H8RP61_9HELO|nr:hypothetical protein LSUB1_G002849 [Lachnellula subtilissima]
MARNRKEKDLKIKLKQPDRSGPDPSQETLLQLADQHGLLNIPQAVGNDKAEPAEDEEPLIGRLPESIFWSVSLTMLHFTMDVLVARQFAVEMEWDNLMTRSAQAFPGSISAGSYLIHITNTYDYYAVMKQAPPMGCLWIWAVIELDLKESDGMMLRLKLYVWVKLMAIPVQLTLVVLDPSSPTLK